MASKLNKIQTVFPSVAYNQAKEKEYDRSLEYSQE